MSDEQWRAEGVRAIGLRLAGDAIDERGPRGERVTDDTLLLLLNANDGDIAFRLPPSSHGAWRLLLDTRTSDAPTAGEEPAHDGGTEYPMIARSAALFRLPRAG